VFVKALGGKRASWGVGKLIGRSGDTYTVEYFDAPTSATILAEFSIAEIERAIIPEQTRIYYFNPSLGRWEIGRLLDDHGDRQTVQFPNQVTRHLNVVDVHVRWSTPIADPTPFLANRINESPRFSDGRTAFIRSQIAQRAASLGMSAILSSIIDLEGHQVEVVRRVLQDPVQRYLLADEVGLGKTIEAGLLIRQCVLDCGKDAQIVIVVPDALVDQWQLELVEKFHLGGLIGQQIHILPMGRTADSGVLREHLDLLVVDEAHHLSREGVDSQNYRSISAAAISAQRVLLLSATPVLHNEVGFLAMLHLLDPDTYSLDGLEALQKRIAARQPLAEIVAGLLPENVMYLDYTVDALTRLFPEDALLQSNIARLRDVLNAMPSEDDPELVEAIGRTRAHLSEIYRLDRRILRHRRRHVEGLTPDRAGAEIYRYFSSDRAALTLAIDDWRFKEAVTLDGQAEDVWATRHEVLKQVLNQASQYTSSGSGVAGLLSRLSDLIGDPAGVAPMLTLLARPGLFNDRAAALSRVVDEQVSNNRKCVVFCSDPTTADALALRLRSDLRYQIDRHDPEAKTWTRFNDDPAHCVLICDHRAEEGLNLQGGRKVVIHYDTPLNPNRIEQRLGRVDRYGSGDTVRSVLLVCEDDPFEQPWTQYLDGALKIFDRSVASLQYLVDQTVRELIPALFNSGTEALEDLIGEHAGEDGLIEKEIKAIDQQDALDALGTPPVDLVDQLCAADDAWRQIANDTALWLEQTLMFERLSVPAVDAIDRFAAPFRYRFATGSPHTLLPLRTFMDACADSVDLAPDPRFARAVKTFPYTFHRRTALSKAGRTARTRLLRYGEPLLRGISDITDADDRGRSFALWRFDPHYSATQAADVYLRFDFLVEANLDPVFGILSKHGKDGPAARAALRRRGDLALAPAFSTIWLDSSLSPIEAGTLRASLERPYRNSKGADYSDININAYRWPRIDRTGIDEISHWADHCEKARAAAERLLRCDNHLLSRLRLAERQMAEVDYRRLSQLEVRFRQDPTHGGEPLEFERELATAMLDGVRQPHIRLETIGAIFLTGSSAMTDRIAGGT